MGFVWAIALVGGLAFVSYRWRVMRAISIVIALVVAVVVGLFQSLDLPKGTAGGGTEDSSIIRKYDADFTVAADGNQRLVETLDVEFTQTRRGIFRFFDEADGVDPNVTHPVTVEAVQRCPIARGEVGTCVAEPYDEYYEDGYLVAKVGDASVPYPAGTANRYIITSSTTGAFTQPRGTPDVQWYWDVIGAGWSMPIRQAEVTATFPVAPTAVRCITVSGACETDAAEGQQVVTGTYSGLDPFTPVTWQADVPPVGLSVVPVGEEPGAPAPWWQSWLLLIPGLLVAGGFWWWLRSLNERPASEAPVFAEPTKDILPAVWTYQEQAPKHSFQTMLLQLQQLGAVQVQVPLSGGYLDTNPESVQVSRTPQALPMIAGASDLVEGMGMTQPGATVAITKTDTTVGQRIQSTEKAISKLADHSAEAMGYYHRSGAGIVANVIAAALPLLSLFASLALGLWWLGIALLLPAVAGLWATKSMKTQLTESGLRTRDQVSGLHTALSTKASVERFDYSLKARYFAQYLPWAVALGCAEKWADACKPDLPEGDSRYYQDPTYMAAWNTYNTSQIVSTAVASVSAGAVAAYAATQSSSSGGGGGGFSSGGGSGGGGGGSW